MVSQDDAIDNGFVRESRNYIRTHFSGIRYRDYFQDPNADDITWVASEPRSITISWVNPDDGLSIYMQIRNNLLWSSVLLAFKLCGCRVLDSDNSPSLMLQIPDYPLRKLPRTRGLRKQHQRRQFLQMFPFLICNKASNAHDEYIETIPEFRPSSFAEAIVDSKYIISEVTLPNTFR